MVLTACSGPAPPRPAAIKASATAPVRAPPASYYLALGDSLAQGVQPNAAGVSVMTRTAIPTWCTRRCAPAVPG